jgi:indolepyruvate ferredoxin oxidoreductase alpha subunit
MIPAYARPAHHRLRDKMAQIAAWNEAEGFNRIIRGTRELGILSSGVAAVHALEAAPQASHLIIGMTWPLPLETIRRFADSVERLLVIEEGDPILFESVRSAGIPALGKPQMYRFGELNVPRVRRILAGDTSPEPPPPKGKPPALCQGCSHRDVFEVLRDMDCIVSGDIGCYTLGVLPPFSAMDTCVCMGASIGVGLGLRHALPPEEARRVVSVIGDSTFVHSGITGLAEMVYNPPATGHVVVILDNGTTAMTGQQEHPGTGRTLSHDPTGKIDFAALGHALGIQNVHSLERFTDGHLLEGLLKELLAKPETSLVVVRQPCVLAAPKIRFYEKAALEKMGHVCAAAPAE